MLIGKLPELVRIVGRDDIAATREAWLRRQRTPRRGELMRHGVRGEPKTDGLAWFP